MKKFDSEIFSHYYWLDTAERLKISAEVLYEKLSELYDRNNRVTNLLDLRKTQLAIFQSYMMLIGFSLENLIKAVSIRFFTSGGKLIDSFKNLQNEVWQVKNAHDLLAIADKCNFALTDDEKDLIERHSEFLIWAGRYHIPKDIRKYEEAFQKQKLRRKKGDQNLIQNLFAKAKTYLDS